jgi:hypothetical protein
MAKRARKTKRARRKTGPRGKRRVVKTRTVTTVTRVVRLAGLSSSTARKVEEGLGVAVLGGLAFVFRRPIVDALANLRDNLFGAAQGTVEEAQRMAAQTVKITLDMVAAAALSIPTYAGAAYFALPDGPQEPGEDRSITSLMPAFQSPAMSLQAELNAILGPMGYEARVGETRRSAQRQLYLWGIGRLYKAPGRSSIVTKIKTPSTDKHFQGLALDFVYRKIGGGEALEKDYLPVLQANASRLESKYGMRWGGNFSGSFKDWPHWEAVG